MKEKHPCSWLIEGPIDYELKNYKMLAELSRLRKQLDAFEVWPVIRNIEDQLDHLYKMKYEIESISEQRRIAKDIDFINFEIIYETLQDETSIENSVIDVIIDEAILEFGDLYADSREVWRDIEKQTNLTWIPKKPRVLNAGYVFVPYQDGECYVYTFEKPTKMTNGWRRMKLEFVEIIENKPFNIIKACDSYQNELDTIMFCRIDSKSIEMPLEKALLPVIKQVLYNTLSKDFA